MTVTPSRSPPPKPSIEDVVLGVIPGLPKVNLHNRLLSPSVTRHPRVA